jgi:hypothetical protein
MQNWFPEKEFCSYCLLLFLFVFHLFLIIVASFDQCLGWIVGKIITGCDANPQSWKKLMLQLVQEKLGYKGKRLY